MPTCRSCSNRVGAFQRTCSQCKLLVARHRAEVARHEQAAARADQEQRAAEQATARHAQLKSQCKVVHSDFDNLTTVSSPGQALSLRADNGTGAALTGTIAMSVMAHILDGSITYKVHLTRRGQGWQWLTYNAATLLADGAAHSPTVDVHWDVMPDASCLEQLFFDVDVAWVSGWLEAGEARWRLGVWATTVTRPALSAFEAVQERADELLAQSSA